MIKGRKSRPGMLGLRFLLFAAAPAKLVDQRHDGLAVAGSRARPNPDRADGIEPSSIGWIAERNPSLRLLINHFAGVRGATHDAAHANQPALLALAKYPNVAVKATGAPGNLSQPYPYRNIHKYIQQIYGMFSPQRMFCGGTDITRMPCSWRQCVTMFTEEPPWL